MIFIPIETTLTFLILSARFICPSRCLTIHLSHTYKEATMAFADWTFLANFLKGSPGQFLSTFAGHALANKFEDAVSHVLRSIDWEKAAKEGPATVSRILGTILLHIPEDKLKDIFSYTMSALRAGVAVSGLPPLVRTVLGEVVDSIDDEVRDMIAEDKFSDAIAVLRAFASGTQIPKKKAGTAAGAHMNTSTTAPADTNPGKAKTEKKAIKITFSREQELALGLMHNLLRASIEDDIIDIEHARAFRVAWIEYLDDPPNNGLVGYLPDEYPDEWYATGHLLLRQLRKAYEYRSTFFRRSKTYRQKPESQKWFEELDQEIENLKETIERTYIEKYLPLITIARGTGESKDFFVGDGMQKGAAKFGDFIDQFLDRAGRDQLRAGIRNFARLVTQYGLPGIGFYALVAMTLLIAGFSSLAGGFFGLMLTFAHPRTSTPNVVFGLAADGFTLGLGLVVIFSLIAAFLVAVPARARILGYAAFMGTVGLIGIQFAAHTLSWNVFNSPRMWTLAPMVLGWILILAWYFWMIPAETIEEALRTHTKATEKSFVSKLVEWALKSSPRPPLDFGSPIDVQKRDPGIWVHFTSLADIVSGYAMFFGTSVVLVVMELAYGRPDHAFVASVAGAFANVLAAGEFLRRGRSSTLTQHELGKEEWELVQLRRSAIKIGAYLAAFAVVEAVLLLVIPVSATLIMTVVSSAITWFSVVPWLFGVLGLGLIVGIVALLWNSKEKFVSEKPSAQLVLGLVVTLLVGIVFVTFATHVYQEQQRDAQVDALFERMGL